MTIKNVALYSVAVVGVVAIIVAAIALYATVSQTTYPDLRECKVTLSESMMSDVAAVQARAVQAGADAGLTIRSTSSAAENERIGQSQLNHLLGDRALVAGSKTLPYSVTVHKPQPKFLFGEPETLSLALDKVSSDEWTLRAGGRVDRGQIREVLGRAMRSIAPLLKGELKDADIRCTG